MNEEFETTRAVDDYSPDYRQPYDRDFDGARYNDHYNSGQNQYNGGYGSGYDAYPPPNNNGSNKAVIAVIVIASVIILVLAGVVTFFLIGNNKDKKKDETKPITTTAEVTEEEPTEEPTIRVVNVVGAKDDDAYQTLNNAGIKYTVSRQTSTKVDEGYVISQNPQSGYIRESERVTLYISKGSGESKTPEPATQAPTAPPATDPPVTAAPAPAPVRNSDYILPYSNVYKYSESEIRQLSRSQMNYALNEIYAREGRKFKDSELQAYFNSKSWYHGYVDPATFDSNVYYYLNSTEIYNMKLITRVQKALGYR